MKQWKFQADKAEEHLARASRSFDKETRKFHLAMAHEHRALAEVYQRAEES